MHNIMRFFNLIYRYKETYINENVLAVLTTYIIGKKGGKNNKQLIFFPQSYRAVVTDAVKARNLHRKTMEVTGVYFFKIKPRVYHDTSNTESPHGGTKPDVSHTSPA